jgi:hypothetical protein
MAHGQQRSRQGCWRHRFIVRVRAELREMIYSDLHDRDLRETREDPK